MTDHVIALPGGVEWAVRARSFAGREEARGEWERIQYEYRDKEEGNFSLWTTTNPEQTVYLVVACGRRGELPEITGEPYELHPDHVRHFALRRARVGLDAVEAGVGHLHHEERYGLEEPMVIDPMTGQVVPYRRR